MLRPGDGEGSAVAPYGIEVYGHERVVAALRRVAASDQAGLAVLLAGPPAVGKRTLARWFAQALVCPVEAALRPCGRCRACRLVAGGGFADVHWLEAPLHIEAVRALQPLLALAPAEGRRRVAVLPEIDQASPGAANSLLKTLEEPPSRVVLVLTTAAVDAVLPTIRSRCRLFRLRPLPAATVATALTAHWDVAEDQALLLARLAGGRLGWAVRAVTQPELLAVRQGWLDSLAEVLAADRGRRLELAAGLAKGRDGNGVVEGLGIWSGWWRDLLLWHHGAETWLVNRDRLAELQAAAVRVSAPEALGAVGAVQAALRRLAVKANLQLTLEVLLLELPPCGAP